MNNYIFDEKINQFERFESLLLQRHAINHRNFLTNQQIISDEAAKNLGRIVRAIRKKLGISQAELALMSEVPHETLMALETGLIVRSEIEAVWLDSLANVFDIDTKMLRSIIEEENNSTPSNHFSTSATPQLPSKVGQWINSQAELWNFQVRSLFVRVSLAMSIVVAVFILPLSFTTRVQPNAIMNQALVSPSQRVIPHDYQIPDMKVQDEEQDAWYRIGASFQSIIQCAPLRSTNQTLIFAASMTPYLRQSGRVTFKP